MATDDLRNSCRPFPHGGTDYVQLASGRRVPQRFTALCGRQGVHFTLTVFVEPDGNGVCTGLVCTSEVDGERPWVTDTIANLPDMGLRAWVRLAVTMAAWQEEHPDPEAWPELPTDLDLETPARQHWRQFAEDWHQQPTRRRKLTTLGRLREVAAVYNEALAAGRHDPTVAVAQALHVSRSQAARLVAQCRGTTPPLLEPVTGRRKGEGP